jgi:hypothetical protein
MTTNTGTSSQAKRTAKERIIRTTVEHLGTNLSFKLRGIITSQSRSQRRGAKISLMWVILLVRNPRVNPVTLKGSTRVGIEARTEVTTRQPLDAKTLVLTRVEAPVPIPIKAALHSSRPTTIRAIIKEAMLTKVKISREGKTRPQTNLRWSSRVKSSKSSSL